MACGGCEDAVKAAPGDLSSVTSAAADHGTGEVVVTVEGAGRRTGGRGRRPGDELA